MVILEFIKVHSLYIGKDIIINNLVDLFIKIKIYHHLIRLNKKFLHFHNGT